MDIEKKITSFDTHSSLKKKKKKMRASVVCPAGNSNITILISLNLFIKTFIKIAVDVITLGQQIMRPTFKHSLLIFLC